MTDNSSKIISLACTLAVALLIVLLLLFTTLSVPYPPKGMELAAAEHNDSIVLEQMGGDEEFVEMGDMQEPTPEQEQQGAATDEDAATADDQTQPEGTDLKDAGTPSVVPPKPVTSTQPSPMKVKPAASTVKPGAVRHNNKPAAKPAVKRQPSQASAINRSMKNAFGRAGTGSGHSQGSQGGNSTGGSLSGHGGLGGGLVGYTVAYWGRPHSYWTGSVVVQVHVNQRGRVTQAHAISGNGQAYAHQEVRRSCERESLKSAFSVPKNRTTEGIGTITWRFA